MGTLRRSGAIEIHFARIDRHFIHSKVQHHGLSKTARVNRCAKVAMAALARL